MGPLEYLRPFVGPLFAWSAAADLAGRAPLSWAVAFLLRFLARELAGSGRVEQLRLVTTDLGVAFRADAKAEGLEVVVGGWECIGGTAPGAARWFSVGLTRKNAAWAFTRGEPYRAIASLEFMRHCCASCCLGMHGQQAPPARCGAHRAPRAPANLGSASPGMFGHRGPRESGLR